MICCEVSVSHFFFPLRVSHLFAEHCVIANQSSGQQQQQT